MFKYGKNYVIFSELYKNCKTVTNLSKPITNDILKVQPNISCRILSPIVEQIKTGLTTNEKHSRPIGKLGHRR